MSETTEALLLPTPDPEQHQPLKGNRAWRWGLASATVLLLLLAAYDPLRPCRLLGAPPETVALTLLAGATEKGAVCLDGSPPGYHLQRGSGSGSNNWLIDLEGGGWCSTLKDCSNRKMSALGSSNFMKPIRFAGAGILDSDQQLNPDFYNWNKVYVRYCDGASFSGDAEGRAQLSVRLVSAMKGGRERSGGASPAEVRRVKWAPDVYDPPVTSVDHSVKSHQQRPRSRKKEKSKQKLKKKKRKSRGKNSGLHDAAHNPPDLQDPGPSSPDDFGDLEPEVVDSDTVRQESEHGSGFAHEMLDDATSSH